MKQSTALDILKTGQNVFLTGQAGAGKTYLLNQYIDYLRARGIPVAITASTGIAATHMNGMTIHSWSGMGIKDSFEPSDFKRLKSRQVVYDRIKDAKVLIVDEISMLHAKQVDLLNEILKVIRDDGSAFGGIQVIFSGDFFQLPPVGNKGETNKEKFAFMAKSWLEANFQVCYLTEQHRQSADGEHGRFGVSLNDILNQIRDQEVSDSAIRALKATEQNDICINRTRLYTHNANVDEINESEIRKIDGKSHKFTASTLGDKALVESLKKSVRAPEELLLKVGAKVMFVKNNPNLAVSNGTLGEVVEFVSLSDDDHPFGSAAAPVYPKVRLNSGRTVIAEPEDWVVENNEGEVLASYTQVPLCLAWAITIHKSQGMTLDAAEIDLSRTFEMGQGYVALSRLRSLDGLKLLGFNQKSLLLDEWVFRVDKRLQELASELALKFDTLDVDALRKIHDTFIRVSDGITRKDIILANEKRIAAEKQAIAQRAHIKENDIHAMKNKPSQLGQTLQETKILLEQGLDISEIAAKRSLADATIIGHIDQLYQQDRSLKIGHVRPDDASIDAVQAAYDTLESQGEFAEGVRLRPIVEMLDGYGYNAVRLALIFINKKDDQNA
ncbi:AAA family ATPase [Moraxella nasibovis]|uniref:AAA family ATPase n=1 Tax=Moraxella nasibovis TaxID=2904120 RepID=UPI00240F34D1|nr:AAA family ATPase [Moraxella nasibovis]WFF39057.1 AAA family ATPase [Moraxella nasibovis]